MTTRDRSTQFDILDAIVCRLRQQIPEFTESTCFVSDHVLPVAWPTGGNICTVVAGAGTFPEEFFTGGGASTLCEKTVVKVTPWVRSKLDSVPKVTTSIVGPQKGLLTRYKAKILRALLCHTKNSVQVAWEPVNEQGEAALRNQLYPISASAPTPAQDKDYIGLTLTFGTDFDWKL